MPWAGFGNQGSHEFSKADAPSFWWGAATAAYQIEGKTVGTLGEADVLCSGWSAYALGCLFALRVSCWS